MIIIEGIDGVGKTTLVDFFVANGMLKNHFDYDSKNMDLFSKYMRILEKNTDNLVLDRSFISEMTYGPVTRGKSKLELEQYRNLIHEYKKVGTKIIYLTAPREVLLLRRQDDLQDYNVIHNYYDELDKKYAEIMSLTSSIIDIIHFDTNENTQEQIQNKVKRMFL